LPKQTFFNLPEDKRQAIIDFAIEEFAKNEYKSASISRIVAEAGIAKGSFYQYFEDKKELYLYLIDLGSQEKAKFLEAHPPPDPKMGTFAYLRWLFSVGVRFELSNSQLAKVAYRAYYNDRPFFDEAMHQAEEQASTFARQLLLQGMANGDLRADMDVESAVFLFNLIILELGKYILARLDIDPDELDEKGAMLFESDEAKTIFDSFLDILENGMGARNSE
jgi:AcrR family transcriptional regulator